MRKPNIELNQLKLDQKKIQLQQIQTQFLELTKKLTDVKNRLDAKTAEVSELTAFVESIKVQNSGQ